LPRLDVKSVLSCFYFLAGLTVAGLLMLPLIFGLEYYELVLKLAPEPDGYWASETLLI